jgi:hypothetical protein
VLQHAGFDDPSYIHPRRIGAHTLEPIEDVDGSVSA